VVDLPRVPDGRAGSNRWGGAAGWVGDAPVNNCQQCRKQPSQGARSLLGG
jgi:hypothetical protein